MRPIHSLFTMVLAAACGLFAFHGCEGGPKQCNPPCTGSATCLDGQCVAPVFCDPKKCGYDGTCVDGGCARVHSGVTCAAPQLIAGGLIGPATPPSSCQRSVQPSVLPSGQIIPLGTHGVGEVVTFTMPPNLASASIVSQAVSAPDTINYQGLEQGNAVVPDQLIAPDGTLWFDRMAPPSDPETAYYNYVGVDSTVVGFMTIPNTERSLNIAASPGGIPAGTWSFRVNDSAYECLSLAGCDGGTDAGQYDLQVLTKPGPASAGATLDLSIYLVETSGLDSGTALTDPDVARFVRTLTAVFAQQGVCPGQIVFYDVPQWATTRYADFADLKPGPCDLLAQMFTLSQPDSHLNLFFVSSFGGGVLGVTGTLPGPSTIGGTVHSGAAVSSAPLGAGTCGNAIAPSTCGADLVAFIAAHEAGHWLGLYHTTEEPGTQFDPLSDTPKCPCQSCVAATEVAKCGDNQSPTLVTNSTCDGTRPACGGADNLMFWLFNTAGKLTPGQGDVIRRNLAMH